MEKTEIYTQIKLMDGSACEILLPRGHNYSRSMRRYSAQSEFDPTIFLMVELVRIDGQQMLIDYFKELNCDDYFRIMECINGIITPIR